MYIVYTDSYIRTYMYNIHTYIQCTYIHTYNVNTYTHVHVHTYNVHVGTYCTCALYCYILLKGIYLSGLHTTSCIFLHLVHCIAIFIDQKWSVATLLLNCRSIIRTSVPRFTGLRYFKSPVSSSEPSSSSSSFEPEYSELSSVS